MNENKAAYVINIYPSHRVRSRSKNKYYRSRNCIGNIDDPLSEFEKTAFDYSHVNRGDRLLLLSLANKLITLLFPPIFPQVLFGQTSCNITLT